MITVVVALTGLLVGFWIWAAPVLLAARARSVSLFSVFGRELNSAAKNGTAAMPNLQALLAPVAPLPPAIVEQIDRALDKKLAVPTPRLPESESRKKK